MTTTDYIFHAVQKAAEAHGFEITLSASYPDNAVTDLIAAYDATIEALQAKMAAVAQDSLKATLAVDAENKHLRALLDTAINGAYSLGNHLKDNL